MILGDTLRAVFDNISYFVSFPRKFTNTIFSPQLMILREDIRKNYNENHNSMMNNKESLNQL